MAFKTNQMMGWPTHPLEAAWNLNITLTMQRHIQNRRLWIWDDNHGQAFEYDCPIFNIQLTIPLTWIVCDILECSSVCLGEGHFEFDAQMLKLKLGVAILTCWKMLACPSRGDSAKAAITNTQFCVTRDLRIHTDEKPHEQCYRLFSKVIWISNSK